MPENYYGVELIGPSQPDYRVVRDGYQVPYLTAVPQGNSRWLLTCDNRFGVELDELDMKRVIPFIANCMAVAAGYSSHGENCEPMNRFKVQAGKLP